MVAGVPTFSAAKPSMGGGIDLQIEETRKLASLGTAGFRGTEFFASAIE